MANIIKRVWNQNRMVQIEDLKGMTFQAEAAGHTFQISGIDDDGNTVALTGTPSGVLLRPDNTDVALTCSVSGGVVSATLPANCYDVPGRFGLTIFITSGSSKTAIYAAVGTVTRTSSGTVAPGTSQSVVDLINAINTAINSIPASYSALLADIAPTYSNSALYSVGQYAWYDGDLKRCIVPITTAESYTAAHWTSAVLGQDVSDLKSALYGNVASENRMADMEEPYIINTSNLWATVGAKHVCLPIYAGDSIVITAKSTAKTFYAFLTDNGYDAGTAPAFVTGGSRQAINAGEKLEVTAPEGSKYLYIAKVLSGTDYTPASVTINGYSALKGAFPVMYELNDKAIKNNDIRDVTNLNDFTESGYYILSASVTYTNSPIAGQTASHLINYKVYNGNYLVQLFVVEFGNRAIYIRRRNALQVWTDWDLLAIIPDAQRSISESFMPVAISSQGNNIGTNIRVMTYNVANYNNDTASYIPNKKLLNLKKILMRINPDIIMTQEDREYINSGNTKNTKEYVFNPQYPNGYGVEGAVIHSKIAAESSGSVYFSNSNVRLFKWALYSIGSKSLLVISAHPIANYNNTGATSEETIAARKTQYENLVNWANRQITLKDYTTSEQVYAPEHTHCIIGMDSNAITSDDKSNILTTASGAGFTSGNGGLIGWFVTCMTHDYSIDTIMCCDKVVINSIEAWNDWYYSLYSDHVPVVAEVTLLD